MEKKLSKTEEIDFHYLLGLMPPLHNCKEFALLPELFCILGHENLIKLAKYAGGEVVQIPTISQLDNSISALQLFYDINIKGTKTEFDIPESLKPLYHKIVEVYNVRND